MTKAHTDGIIGPFFFDEPLTGQIYLDLLQVELIPALTDISANENVRFQQDDASLHSALLVRDFSNRFLFGRWIGISPTAEARL